MSNRDPDLSRPGSEERPIVIENSFTSDTQPIIDAISQAIKIAIIDRYAFIDHRVFSISLSNQENGKPELTTIKINVKFNAHPYAAQHFWNTLLREIPGFEPTEDNVELFIPVRVPFNEWSTAVPNTEEDADDSEI